MSRLLGRALDQPIRPERGASGASMDSPLEDVNRPPGASEPPRQRLHPKLERFVTSRRVRGH
jgi:hypothetical protein